MVWCGVCYRKAESDNFHLNEQIDDEGNRMLHTPLDVERYKQGVDGSHLVSPFQYDLCIFRNLFKRDPRHV